MRLNSFRDLLQTIRESLPSVFKIFEIVSDNFIKSTDTFNDLIERVTFLERPYSRALVHHGVDQAIPTGVLTALTFNTLDEDNDSMIDATAQTRITFRTPGWYVYGGCVQWEFVAGGNRRLAVQLNGATIIFPGDRRTAAVIPGDIVSVCGARLFNQGDYIELMVSQNTGAPLNIIAGAAYTPYFWATMVQKQYNMNAIPNRRQ